MHRGYEQGNEDCARDTPEMAFVYAVTSGLLWLLGAEETRILGTCYYQRPSCGINGPYSHFLWPMTVSLVATFIFYIFYKAAVLHVLKNKKVNVR